jgi:DNA/RNA non-specific endonuclease
VSPERESSFHERPRSIDEIGCVDDLPPFIGHFRYQAPALRHAPPEATARAARDTFRSPRAPFEDATGACHGRHSRERSALAKGLSVFAQRRPSPCARSAGRGRRHQPRHHATRPARAHIWGRWSARSWQRQRGRAGWGSRQTVINAVKDILAGNVGALAAKVEAVMASAIPVVLDFLATLIGIGGKITEIIQKALKSVTQPIQDAIDSVLLAIKKAIGGFIDRLLGKGAAKGAEGAEAAAEVAPGTPMTEGEIITAVVERLDEPTRATEPAAALDEKRQQAELLKEEFQPRAPQGKMLKVAFIDQRPDDVEEDHTIEMEVGFSPGKKATATLGIQEPPRADGHVSPSVDLFGRAKGTTALLTPLLLAETGLSSAATPPGFVANAGLDRGHLVGGQLAGPGSADNVVPLDGSVNKGEMKQKENAAVKAILAGHSLRYNVTPQYGERFRITSNRLTRRGLEFTDPKISEAELPSPIPSFISMGISSAGKEDLNKTHDQTHQRCQASQRESVDSGRQRAQ